MNIKLLLMAVLGSSMFSNAYAGQAEQPITYSPYANSDTYEHRSDSSGKRVLWGDTHLHTTLSLDARAFGVELDQATAYRFARGEQVTSTHGQEVRLARPLDFLVVSDHSDAMGTMNEIIAGNPRFMGDEKVAEWNQRLNNTEDENILLTRMEVMTALTDGSAPEILADPKFFRQTWNDYLAVADKFNDPGKFTAVIGYEWTSSEGGNNLHRNVLYRDGADKASKVLPFTSTESGNPEDLWKALEEYEKTSGGKVLAIAHNGNISNGIMFPEINPETGKPLTKDYAQTRKRWEPLYEVTQIKGDTEAHPLLSPNDEFADYETWDAGNFAGVRKTDEMIPYEYARTALGRGLQLEQNLGTNPYQFGMIGSTDSHTGLATGEEDNFFGKLSYMEPSKDRWKNPLGNVNGVITWGWQMTASGYAAVWAEENTREAIFDAMQRRETYATTGPRMVVKFHAQLGAQHVPMGGELIQQSEKKIAPSFRVEAWKDPMGANLDRIQIIKGWLEDGKAYEKVHDIVWSGDRKAKANGKLPAVGNTVNVESATYENSIGDSHLYSNWRDLDFDAKQKAFYYVRVIEIPTPRWTAFDAVVFNTSVDDEKVPMTTQERAYSSPIWYTP